MNNTETTRPTHETPEASGLFARLFPVSMPVGPDFPRKFMENNFDLGAEVMSFMSRRFQAEAAHWHELGHSRTLNDSMNVQRKFATAAFKDYTEEVSQFLEITRKNLAAAAGAAAEQK